MLICIEGPNACAKTTLAKAISEATGLPYVKENKPPSDGFQYYLSRARGLDNCVLDRFYVGESVYPALKNDGRTPLSAQQQHTIERYLLTDLDSLYIYCKTSEDFCKNVFLTRGEDFIRVDQISDEHRLFQQVMSRSYIPWVPFDVQTEMMDDFVRSTLRLMTRRQKSFALEFEGAGMPQDTVAVLVGDRYGDGAWLGDPTPHRVFSGHAGCSRHLHQALELSGYGGNVYLTNYHKTESEVENERLFRRELSYIKLNSDDLEPPIITLGDVAHRSVKKLGLTNRLEKLKHPQYEFRFHNKEVERYARDLKEAIER